jgi:ABC-type sugar transport system substrate-binding protein
MSLQRRRLWFGLLGVALFAWTGCTNPSTDNAKKGEETPAKSTPTGGKLRIAGVGFQDDQFFKLLETGMRAAAEKNSVEFSYLTTSGALDKEINALETYTTQKVDAICIAPINPKGSTAGLKRAHEAGIRIVTVDSAVEDEFPAATIKSDQIALGTPTGEAAKKYIQEKLGGKAKIAIISYVALLPEPANQRTKGFEDAIKALPGVEIVARQDAWVAEKAVTVVENILTAHPDINLIWAANEGGTVGAVTAVKNAGKSGKVVVFGTDFSVQMGDILLSSDNILQAVTGQKPYDIGTLAIETALKAIKGEKTEKQTLLPGAFFSREQPDVVRKQQEILRGLSQ